MVKRRGRGGQAKGKEEQKIEEKKKKKTDLIVKERRVSKAGPELQHTDTLTCESPVGLLARFPQQLLVKEGLSQLGSLSKGQKGRDRKGSLDSLMCAFV